MKNFYTFSPLLFLNEEYTWQEKRRTYMSNHESYNSTVHAVDNIKDIDFSSESVNMGQKLKKLKGRVRKRAKALLDLRVKLMKYRGMDDDDKESQVDVTARLSSMSPEEAKKFLGDIKKEWKEEHSNENWRFSQLSESQKLLVVFCVQRLLANTKYDCGTIDGGLGKNTRKGISAFQTDNNLGTDGIPGKNTVEKIIVFDSTPIVERPVIKGNPMIKGKVTRGERTKKISDIQGLQGAFVKAQGDITAKGKDVSEKKLGKLSVQNDTYTIQWSSALFNETPTKKYENINTMKKHIEGAAKFLRFNVNPVR